MGSSKPIEWPKKEKKGHFLFYTKKKKASCAVNIVDEELFSFWPQQPSEPFFSPENRLLWYVVKIMAAKPRLGAILFLTSDCEVTLPMFLDVNRIIIKQN